MARAIVLARLTRDPPKIIACDSGTASLSESPTSGESSGTKMPPPPSPRRRQRRPEKQEHGARPRQPSSLQRIAARGRAGAVSGSVGRRRTPQPGVGQSLARGVRVIPARGADGRDAGQARVGRVAQGVVAGRAGVAEFGAGRRRDNEDIRRRVAIMFRVEGCSL